VKIKMAQENECKRPWRKKLCRIVNMVYTKTVKNKSVPFNENGTKKRMQYVVEKLLTVQSSPASHFFLPFRAKYSPHHPVKTPPV
jgi:hypothetical protein